MLTGASAGRTVSLDKDETLVGRVGLQVAALRRTAQGVVLVPVDGERAPTVNGAPAGADGLPVGPATSSRSPVRGWNCCLRGEAPPAPMQGTTRGA